MATTERVALVTGAAGHLGRVVCERFSRDGLIVVRAERARAFVGETPIADVDLGSAEATARLVERVIAHAGRLDVAVHTVGAFATSGSGEVGELEAFRSMLDTNLMTTVHLLGAVLGPMRAQGHGRAVVVSSTAALAGGAGTAAYSASKAAQLRVVESAAAELRGEDVAITAVLPGTMDTPPNRAAMPTADRSTWVTLEEVAEVIAFLAGATASALSGRAIEVSRGR